MMKYKKATRKTKYQIGGNRAIINTYKTLLANYAYSDARHDFNKDDNFYDRYKNTIQDSIPNIRNPIGYTEDGLIQTIEITHINDEPNISKFNINNILENYSDMSVLHAKMQLNNRVKREYNINVVLYQEDKDVVVDPDGFEHYFNTKRTFVIDHFNLKFYDGFKNNNNDRLYNENDPYYILYNREMKNDAADKVHLNADTHIARTGYCLKEVEDTDRHDIVYNKWNNNQIDYKSMFYCNYDLILRNISDNTELIISDPYTSIRYVYNDLRTSNNINALKRNVYANIISPTIAFIRKRSGDCLQALSVLDANDRRELSDNNAYKNPKMLITHDRLALYYSLLLGIDIGYTVIRTVNNIKMHYLITFVNENEISEDINNYLKYTTYQSGGRNNRMNKTIKLKRKKIIHNLHSKMVDTLEFKYNQLMLDDIIQYKRDIHVDSLLGYESRIVNKYNIYIKTNKQNDIINYIKFTHGTDYSKEHISKLIYSYYVNTTVRFDNYKHIIPIITSNENSYYSIITNLEGFHDFYKIRGYINHMKDIANFYKDDTQFTKYLGSIRCLLWMLNYYANMWEEHTFNSYDIDKFKLIMAPELKELYNNQTNKEYDDYTRFRELAEIIYNIPEYKELYQSVCYTCDWSFTELRNILRYTYNHNLNMYDVLQILASDFNWGKNKEKPAKTGYQSTSIGLLNDLGYNYEYDRDRTPVVQIMLNELYSMPNGGYIKDFNESRVLLAKMIKQTVEEQLTWGLRIV